MHGLGDSSQAEVLPLWTLSESTSWSRFPNWMQWILAQVYVEEMQNFLVEHFYGEKRGALDQAGKSSGL